MKKSLLAVAVAATLIAACAPEKDAKAAGAVVYGQLDQQITMSNGATDASADDAYVGFTVSEDLGNGASATANISLDLDTENTDQGSSATRDAYVALDMVDFTVMAGRMSNLTKQVTSSTVDIFEGASFGADGGTRADSVVAISVGDVSIATVQDNGGEDKIDSYEVAISHDFGAVGVSGVYTEDKATSATTKQFGATTNVGALSVGATYEIANDDTVTVTAVAATDFGNNTLRGGIEDVENGDQTYIAELAHNFSKSTAAYVNYSTDDNDATDPTTIVGMRMVF